MTNPENAPQKGIDWMITLVPLAMIAAFSVLFVCFPAQSNAVLGRIRFLLGDTLGVLDRKSVV